MRECFAPDPMFRTVPFTICLIICTSSHLGYARRARQSTQLSVGRRYNAGKLHDSAPKIGSPRALAMLLLASDAAFVLQRFPAPQSYTRFGSSARLTLPPILSAVEEPVSSGKASVPTSIINLVKALVGSGMLALPAGVVAFSSASLGVVPALILLLGFGALSGYSFALAGRICNEIGAESYSGAWAKLFGKRTALVPAFSIIFLQATGLLSYSVILGDGFASIARLMGLPLLLRKASTWIIGLSASLLFPISLLRDFSSMTIGSVIGSVGSLYTALFMLLRLADRTYGTGGKFHEILAPSARPLFSPPSHARPLLNPSIFVFVSIASAAFSSHPTSPAFLRELAPPTDGSSKEQSFTKVVAAAFGVTAFLYASVMVAGYLTFGGASQGFILNSYATTDPLALLARIGTCASISFTYPMVMKPLRESLLEVFNLDGSKRSIHVISTLLLVCLFSSISLVVKDLGVIVAMGGAVAGNAQSYTLIAMMFIKTTLLKMNALKTEGKQLPGRRLKEMYANYGMAVAGVALGLLGLQTSLKHAAS